MGVDHVLRGQTWRHKATGKEYQVACVLNELIPASESRDRFPLMVCYATGQGMTARHMQDWQDNFEFVYIIS